MHYTRKSLMINKGSASLSHHYQFCFREWLLCIYFYYAFNHHVHKLFDLGNTRGVSKSGCCICFWTSAEKNETIQISWPCLKGFSIYITIVAISTYTQGYISPSSLREKYGKSASRNKITSSISWQNYSSWDLPLDGDKNF